MHPLTKPASRAVTQLTAERLREILSYDQDTGVFHWKIKRLRSEVGAVAGSAGDKGYIYIVVDGKLYRGHRLAWLWVHGNWPLHVIDHINGDPGDNRIANLRDATRRMNVENQHRASKGNKTGYLGVYPAGKRFAAQIQVANKGHYIGLYDTPEEAHAAYVERKRQVHAGCQL